MHTFTLVSRGIDSTGFHQEFLRFAEASIGRNNPASLEVLSIFYQELLGNRFLSSFAARQPNNEVFIQELQSHIVVLHMSALVSLSEGNWTTSSITRFYEVLSRLSSKAVTLPGGIAAVALPPPLVVYLLGFSFQLDGLSRLCSILASYKAAFETGVKASVRWPAEFTARFNGYLMDVCNLLWRSRALTKADSNSMGALCPEPVFAALRNHLTSIDREYNVGSMFGFSHSPLLCNLSVKALEVLEDEAAKKHGGSLIRHQGPVSQRTLAALGEQGGASIQWKEYRTEMLVWLVRHGISGVRELMFVTMKDLMKGP